MIAPALAATAMIAACLLPPVQTELRLETRNSALDQPFELNPPLSRVRGAFFLHHVQLQRPAFI